MRLQLSPDPTEGGTPAAPAPAPAPTPTPTPAPAPAPTPAPAPAPTAAPPTGAGPASVVVVTGQKSERELELEREAETLRRSLKDRETTICELQDKHENFRKSVEQPPATKKKKIGVGFFETDEDEEGEA